VVEVVVLELPPAALGRIEAAPLAAAPVELVAPAALGRTEAAPLAAAPVAPTALEDGLVVVVVVDVEVVGAAARTSMNTSIWPLLEVLMNVPAVAGVPLDDVDGAADDDELGDAPLLLMNEPVHSFCVSSWV
jgi:hypothetical protein